MPTFRVRESWQAVLKKGEVAIREREEEIRMLDLAVAEQCREIEVTPGPASLAANPLA